MLTLARSGTAERCTSISASCGYPRFGIHAPVVREITSIDVPSRSDTEVLCDGWHQSASAAVIGCEDVICRLVLSAIEVLPSLLF
jgi:hypothetical protein